MFLSTDNGTSWIQVNNGLSVLSTYIRALAVSGINIFAGTEFGGIYLSTNNGTNWLPVNTALTDTFILSLATNGTELFAGTFGGGLKSRPLAEYDNRN